MFYLKLFEKEDKEMLSSNKTSIGPQTICRCDEIVVVLCSGSAFLYTGSTFLFGRSDGVPCAIITRMLREITRKGFSIR